MLTLTQAPYLLTWVQILALILCTLHPKALKPIQWNQYQATKPCYRNQFCSQILALRYALFGAL